MRKTNEQNSKYEIPKINNGITLIALVITVIVMLILVAVTITMAVNGGLFGKAADAGRQTNEAVALEQELGSGKIKIKDGSTIYEYDNINAYFTNTPSKVYEESEIPEEPETPEGNEPPQNEGTLLPTTEKGVGYYADLDGDGEIETDTDGIIYADMAKGNTNGTMWYNEYGTYTIPVKTNLKEYNLSEETVNGPFGPKKVVTLANDDETKNDRFYVMALMDYSSGGYYSFYWDKNNNKIQFGTSEDFGSGDDNTKLLIEYWDNIPDSDKEWDDGDIWKNLSGGDWFVPSRAEWSAFAKELGVYENYSNYGIGDYYWSSSQYDTGNAWRAGFDGGCMYDFDILDDTCVRLSTTF